MRKLMLLSIAVASLIAVPSAFAHGKASHHGRMHVHARHATHRIHHDNISADRAAAMQQASQSERGAARHPDEEELGVDELAQKAN